MNNISIYSGQRIQNTIKNLKSHEDNIEHHNPILNNPFITSANQIIAFILHIKKSKMPQNLEKIRNSIVNEIKNFENQLSFFQRLLFP